MKRRSLLKTLFGGVVAAVAVAVVPKAKAAAPKLYGGAGDNKLGKKWLYGDGSGELGVYHALPFDGAPTLYDAKPFDGVFSCKITRVNSKTGKVVSAK